MTPQQWAELALLVVVGTAVVVGGVPFVDRMIRFIDRSRPGNTQPHLVAAAVRLRGGAWIGVLERLSVFASLLAGFPEGIALVIALKGLARYPELRGTTSGAAELFIIGTFLSLLLASAGAGLVLLAGRLLGTPFG